MIEFQIISRSSIFVYYEVIIINFFLLYFVPLHVNKGTSSSTDGENDDKDGTDELIQILEESDEESVSERAATMNSNQYFIVQFLIVFLLRFRAIYRISDHATTILLKFFKKLFSLMSSLLALEQLQRVADKFPVTLNQSLKIVSSNTNTWKEYIVCTKCHTLYSPENIQDTEILCTHVEYPDHPQLTFRVPCGNSLFKTVRRKAGNTSFIPKKLFYYREIKDSIKAILMQPGFLALCNRWMENKVGDDMLGDVIDGCVWQDVLKLLKKPCPEINTLGLLLNVDWFQPYKHISYSVGVIYAVLVNLPRHLRYKSENIIIIGIIPGPHEPKKSINSYLGIVVHEFLELWKGVWICFPQGRTFINAIFVGLAADILASRKAAGFCGHAALKGCSRCLKSFVTKRFGDKPNYGGFNVSEWPKRCHRTHTLYGYKVLSASTKQERKRLEREYGARYSVLYELPYYDCIRFIPIDPMHNLFLGTAKHIMNTWKNLQLLNKTDFSTIQLRIASSDVPSDVGRIPSKVEACMGSLTADEWKNWTCIYSPYALWDVLPPPHMQCWLLFVKACRIICQPVLRKADVDRVNELLVDFCQRCERLYGSEFCTMNLHLHCHLKECLFDYGPSHGFWCFAFERCNGILGSYPNNNKNIEKTMMNRFMEESCKRLHCSSEIDKELEEIFPTNNNMGSVYETQVNPKSFIRIQHLTSSVDLHDLKIDYSIALPIGPFYEYGLDDSHVSMLTSVYSVIHCNDPPQYVGNLCERFPRLKIANHIYSSKLARSERAMYLCSYWASDDGLRISTNSFLRPGYVHYYIKHNVLLTSGMYAQHFFAYVSWYEQYHLSPETHLPSPLSLWSNDTVPLSPCSFLPVCRIVCPCLHVKHKLANSVFGECTVVIVNPIGTYSL